MTYPDSPTDDPVRKVKLDALEFDSWLKSTANLNWLDKMDKYCEWYNISDAQCLSITGINLVGNA